MSAKARRSGFTLVEILIVVVIMAVLAATIIPQFTASSEDAKVSALKYNLHTLRSQIELYRMQHNGNAPAITDGTLPQLLGTTNADGEIGTGTNYPYGPYITGPFPVNPLDNKSDVVATSTWPGTATAAGGWLYQASTGKIAPNTAGHEND